ncbi:MAG TPA: hypothetical protein VFX60_11750 [Micromonospora sp.]|nr:hypothetical protein [Micromonospora sp.]
MEEKKRMVRRLVRDGRGFAEEFGFRVTSNAANLFQLLYLSILLRSQGDYRRAVQAALALRDRGWDTPANLARSPEEERFRVIRDASHRRDARRVAATLGELAEAILQRYRGDLRRLRSAARKDPTAERELLKELPGVDDAVVDLFFRDVQIIWREVAPFADRRALAAARRLGLGRSTADLAALAGSPESERLGWLFGALARIDLENRYDEFREATG